MRLTGVNIPDQKKIKISLTYIFGIGQTSAFEVLEEAGIDPEKRTKDLEPAEANKIKTVIEKNYEIEGELRQKIKKNIRRLKDLETYRGERHKKGLPVRGQSTKRNSRTARPYSGRKTAGSGKQKLELK